MRSGGNSSISTACATTTDCSSSPERPKKGKRIFLLRSFVGWLFSYRDSKYWFNRFDRFAQYKKDNGFFVIPSSGPTKKHFSPLPREMFLPPRKMQFDDISVFVPHQAESFCVYRFGDWRTIPSSEDRWNHYIIKIQM